jgi:hypothetical protein
MDASPPEFLSPGPLAAPFLIDLSTEQTAMWQRAMHGSVAVVKFDRHTLRWLEGCSAPGLYGSRRVRTDPASASLQGIDEIRLNIPGSADWVDTTDTVLDDPLTVAFLVTGEHVNMRSELRRKDLSGPCDGATHFVHRMEVGVQARAFGPPERFTSAREVFQEAGRDKANALSSCLPTHPERGGVLPLDPACAWPLRVHLVALDLERLKDPMTAQALQTDPCPSSTFLRGHHCGFPRSGASHLCKLGDPSDCGTQCGLGHGSSCNHLGWMHEHGLGVAMGPEAAESGYRASCELGDARGCLNLARILESRSLPASASLLLEAACDRNSGLACARLAALHAVGKGVAQRCDRAENLMERACRLGFAPACTSAALGGGELGPCEGATLVHRNSFLAAGCAGADLSACTLLAKGFLWDLCRGSPSVRGQSQQHAPRAIDLLGAACNLRHEAACITLRNALADGFASSGSRTNESNPDANLCEKYETP